MTVGRQLIALMAAVAMFGLAGCDNQSADDTTGSIDNGVEQPSSVDQDPTPQDGTGGLYDLPDVGLGFFDVIPAMRNKFHRIDELGPQSLPKKVDGVKQGTVEFDFSE